MILSRRIERIARAAAVIAIMIVPRLGEAQTAPPSNPLATPAAPSAPAPATNPASPVQSKIVDIIVIGNKNINRDSIISASGLSIGEPYTPDLLTQAQQRLLQTGNFGWHHTNPNNQVKVTAETTGDQTKIVIQVDENDKIEGINITGAGPIPVAQILKVMALRPGDILNLVTLRQDFLAIQNLYEKQGYTALVSSNVNFTNGILNIPIIVTKVHAIKITGLHKTRPIVVTREMKTKVGSYFSTVQLRKDITNIYNTNLFDEVLPSVVSAGPGEADININITEKRTGSASLGIGYSSLQQLVGTAQLTETNFQGLGETVSLMWETGGVAGRNSFELGFTQPWLDRNHTSLSVDLFNKTVYRFAQNLFSQNVNTLSNNDYYEVHVGGDITLSRPMGSTYRGYVGLRYDDVRVNNIPTNTIDASVLQNGPISDLTLRLLHDTLDFDAEPAVGGTQTYSVDVGHAVLSATHDIYGNPIGVGFGAVNFVKTYLEARQYFSPEGRRINPNDKRHVIEFRLMVGTSLGTLPFTDLYFIGGANTLRGYREGRFWGKNMFLGSIEYQEPLANALTGVVFVDVGDAWGGPYQGVTFTNFTQHAGFSPSVGIGFGIRVRTPIGPIKIDEGFGSEGARTEFSFGQSF